MGVATQTALPENRAENVDANWSRSRRATLYSSSMTLRRASILLAEYRLDPAGPVGQLDEAHRRPLRGAVPDALALVGVNVHELRVEVPCREFLLDELRRQRLDRELATGARHGLVAHGRHAPILDDRPGALLEAELDARDPMERPGSQ